MRNPFLIGEQVYLRPIEEADAARCYEWFSDPEVRFQLGRAALPNTEQASLEFIRGVDGATRQMFAIVVRADGSYIGNCDLFGIHPVHRHAEIGIAIAQGMYKGRETTFVVQVFGKPASLAADQLPQNPPSSADISAQPTQEAESAAGTVSGETLEGNAQARETNGNLKIVAQDDMFIGVQNLDLVAPEEGKAQTSVAYASWLDKLLSSPNTMLTSFYAFISALILAALVLMVFVEIRQQHPLHILYGFLLLALIGALVWSQKAILLSHVSII